MEPAKKPTKQTKRVTTGRLNIWLSHEDKQAIATKAKQANLSITDYVVRAALEKEIAVKPTAALPELYELQKIGFNLNQAVRLGNTHKSWVQEIEVIVGQIKAILDVHKG